MKSVNWKKLLLPNLPYLLFVYLFDKVGQAARLAPGADFSGKLLSIGDGFAAAFASAAPSFHPIDLLVGVAGAVLIRLVVYVKSKNAKKYRKGIEYGFARCLCASLGRIHVALWLQRRQAAARFHGRSDNRLPPAQRTV